MENIRGRNKRPQSAKGWDKMFNTYWVKFEYMIPDGQTVEAWVATCNLICYDKLQNNHMALLEDD